MRFLLVSHNVFEWTVSQIFLDEQCIIVYISTDILLFFFDGITFWYVRNVRAFLSYLMEFILSAATTKKNKRNVAILMNLYWLYVFVLYLSFACCRLPSMPLSWWRYWFWDGDFAYFEDQGRVPWPDVAYFLCVPIAKGLRYSCWALQRHPFCSPACWECWWVHGVG